MYLKTKYIIYIVFLVLTSSLCAQQITLTGKVTDVNNEPLIGASVYIKSINKGVSTDSNGTYVITNLNRGSYTITASYLGFESANKNVVLNNKATATLDFVLRASSEQLQEVEIVGRKAISYKPDVTFAGTKTGANVRDVAQSIGIVTKELMDDQKILRVADIAGSVAGLTQVGNGDSFMSRGFQVSHDFVNGNPQKTNSGYASSSNTVHLERVEVIKGPAAALFGSSSPGGIINSVTKKPLKENRASATFSVGSFDTKRATMDITGPLNEDKELLYRLNIGWEDAASYRDFVYTKNLLIAPSISYLVNEKTSFNIDLVSTVENNGSADQGSSMLQNDLYGLPISFNVGEPYDYRENSQLSFTASMNHKFNKSLSINASYNNSDFNESMLVTRSGFRFTEDGTELEREIDNQKRKSSSQFATVYLVGKFNTGTLKHEALFGADYFDAKDQYRTRIAVGEVNGVPNLKFKDRVVYDDYVDLNVTFSEVVLKYIYEQDYKGVYLQDLITWNKLKVLLGLRYDIQKSSVPDTDEFVKAVENQIDNDVWLPRVGITYAISDSINLFASYAESYELQSVPLGVNTLNPGEAFDPLTSNQVDFGAKGSFFDNNMLITASLYHINRKGRLIPDPNGGIISILQVGNEQSRGLELDIIGRVNKNVSLSANFAYNEVKILDDIDAIYQLELENNNPNVTFGYWGKYSFNKGFFKNLNLGLGGNYVSDSSVRLIGELIDYMEFKSYVTTKMAIGYKYKNFDLSFNLNNIFDERYYIGGFNSSQIYPGTPRNFLATLGYSF